jgi:ribonucleoside-diphosphate reductase alpha chain
MCRVGRRNIAMLTIAPTGTVSICTQTTSGIEPVFMVAYKRRRKVNANDKDVHVTFTDVTGNSFEEYNVFHHKFITWLEVNGYNVEEVLKYDDEKLNAIIAKSPYYKATANDIDWVNKVKMQGSMQKWVDHSISVTVNVPKETTEELVSQIYMTAWESGCKGMTIYRDGSRDGVLVSKDEKKEESKSGTISLTYYDITLVSVGDAYTFEPKGGSGGYTWKSADPKVATVSDSGTVTAAGKGQTKVTVKSGDGLSAEIIVRVPGK